MVKIEETSIGRIIETDVLILGAGAAGSGAAIAARRQGVDVVLIDKGKLESCGSAGGGNDHFMAVLEGGDPSDTLETLVGFFAKPISGYTPAMIEKGWFEIMPQILQILEEENVQLLRNEDGSYMRTQGFGQPGKWWINISGGQTLKRKIAKRVRAEGAHIFNYILVTKLLTNGDHISGCLGYHVLTGEFHIFKAKKVVCCFGKTVSRVSVNSTGNPFNCWYDPYTTGAYYVLPFEAGAKILNLDIAESATLIPKGFGAPGMNGINSMGGHELNALGERFMGKYDPMWENGVRRNQIQGTYQEMIEGKGPPFYMDMTHFPEEDAHHLQYVLMPGDKATYTEWTDKMGIDFKRDPLEVEISELSLQGLLYVKDNFETNISGLYSGCVFPYVSGALCGGYYAGRQAAIASQEGTLFEIDDDTALCERNRIFNPLALQEGIDQKIFEGVVRNVMQYYMGFRRNEKGMKLALEKLMLIAEYEPKIRAKNYHELLRIQESLFLHRVSVLTTLACLERKESGRAIYKRTDFPNIETTLNKPLVIWKENEEVRFSWESIR